jgi:hypothetical protein
MLHWSTDALYGLGLLGILGVAAHIVWLLIRLLGHSVSYATLLTALDPLMLLLMLAELLHIMTLAIHTHHLPLKPVLALIWLAFVRHGVVLATTASPLATANAAATFGGVVLFTVLLAWLHVTNAD